MANLTKPTSSAPYLLMRLQDKSMTPEQFNPRQRRICIRFLLQERKHTQVQIATILHIDQSFVSHLKKRIQNENSWMIDEMDERRVGVDIIEMAEAASASLFRKGREKDAWTVLRESIELMQTLGFVKRKPVEMDLKANLTIQEMLKLATDHSSEDEKNRIFGTLTNGSNGTSSHSKL